jgi:hypothetical protein
MGKPKVPPIYTVLVGAILEVIGIVLLSRISTTEAVDRAQYGYQFLAGFGTGMLNAGLVILVPYIMEKRDLGKSKPFHYEGRKLIFCSCWFCCKLAIPYPWRTRGYRHRGFGLDALHSHSSYGYRVSRDSASSSGKDGNCQNPGSGCRDKCSQSVREGIQSSSPDIDWLCCRQIACYSTHVDKCQVRHLRWRMAIKRRYR